MAVTRFKLIAAASAVLVAVSATSAFAGSKSRHKRAAAGAVAAGVAIGVGALLANEAAKANGYYDSPEDRMARKCYRWDNRCADGDRYSCKMFYRNCE